MTSSERPKIAPRTIEQIRDDILLGADESRFESATIKKALTHLLNYHSVDSFVGVADDILAQMLIDHLLALRSVNVETVRRRDA